MEGRVVSELRLYLRRGSLEEGTDCSWAFLDDGGRLQSSGTRLEDLPRAQRCRLVLAGDLVLTVKASLPDLPDRRLAPLLPAAAEAATLVEAETIHAVVMERSKAGEATLAVLEEAWLKRILSKLAGLGLHPDSALPEYLLLPWMEGCWSVGWCGSDSLARFGKGDGMSLDDGEPPVGLSLALAQRSRPDAIKVYQGGKLGAPDWPRWRAALDIPVEDGGSWDWRSASWPDVPGVLQGRHAPGRNRLDWRRLVRPVAWGAISLAGIHLVGMTLDWAMLARESAAIREDMHMLAERALPAHAAVVDPPWQVKERLQALSVATGNPAPNALVGLLGKLSQVWPAGSNTRVQTLTYEGGTLTVSLARPDAAWLESLKTAAAAGGLAIGAQENKDADVLLTVKPTGKGDGHGQ
jgi:type II secretion system protein L